MSALTQREREAIHGYWRAANYLAVGQIYLLDNPLLRKPLWTSPELKFI
jgi:xylulose-5-phosphate/fructose-6-phosphate phosphoketolase